MPTVLFIHDKPRAAAKVGPLLKKKGFEVLEAEQPADVVIVDSGEDSVARASAALEKRLGEPGRVIVTSKPQDAELPQGIVHVPGGKLVEEIVRLCGPASENAAAESATNVEEIIRLKAAKVRELRARGVEPFPHRFEKKDDVCAITVAASTLQNEERSGKRVTTAGRIMQLRLMGKAAFFHLQDKSGKAQAY
ncbi:MAG: hypothetical protein HY553_14030, partial [Elusimicrobia bacterium]|nr:hypothetical protein [Elusimicrobiota bacterium]